VDGANRHDVRLLSATLNGLVISRPEPTPEQPQHLCLDAAYDSTPVYQELVARHYQPYVRSRGEEQREKEITPGSIARAVSSFGGRRRWRIIVLSFIWPVLNSSSPRSQFSDKLLEPVCAGLKNTCSVSCDQLRQQEER